MPEQTAKTIPAPVLKLPTQVANKFYIMANKINLRLVLGEEVLQGGPVNFHHAFVLAVADARTLADHINAACLEAETLAPTSQV